MRSEYSLEELLPILDKKTKKFTMGDSSSVPYSRVRQLMASILYCIEGAFEYETGQGLVVQKKLSAQEVYELGLGRRKEKLRSAQKLYKDIKQEFHSYGNRCWFETVIKGIQSFFDYYSLEFDATNSIITLDYPLIMPVKELEGIDEIFEYLKRVRLEQRFLQAFKDCNVRIMLSAYDGQYKEGFFNICSVVLRNCVGMLMADMNPYKPLCSQALEKIKQYGYGQGRVQLKEKMLSCMKRLIEKDFNDYRELYEYLLPSIEDLSFEYMNGLKEHTLEAVFPIYIHKKQGIPYYEDGIMMDDKRLRGLIEEIKSCRYTEDKLLMIKENIKSLEDLKEVLGECFSYEQYNCVFKLLSEEEISLMRQDIRLKKLFDVKLKDWEEYLIAEYVYE